MSRTTRHLAEAAVCAALGSLFAAGCVIAADDPPPSGNVLIAPTHSKPSPFGMVLTPEQIDVLTESESPDHPWESCTITGELITCPDGYTVTWQQPPPDGAEHRPGAYTAMRHLPLCPDTDKPSVLPCRVPMDPTYVVGGDGAVHNRCTIALTTAEDSEMVCRDDTVWAS